MRRSSLHHRHRYRQRTLACTVLSLLAVLGVVHLWPAPGSHDDRIYTSGAREIMELDDIQPRAHTQRPPPPPRPALPVVVPDATGLDDVELDLTDAMPLDETTNEAGGDRALPAQVVDEAPRAYRYVVAEYTESARERGIRATVQIEVHVDERGRVQEANIVERVLLDQRGQRERRVEELGYGLDQAVLAAARRWLFRPARRNGEPVASVTTIQLDVGDTRSNS